MACGWPWRTCATRETWERSSAPPMRLPLPELFWSANPAIPIRGIACGPPRVPFLVFRWCAWKQSAFIALCKTWPGDVVGTHLKGTEDFRRNYKSPTLLVMGSERRGLSEELAATCSSLVRIPMPGGAESLNVATATALMLYEAVKP